MSALLSKEFRQLAPIAWLWVAIIALGFASRLIGKRIDEQSFGAWFDDYLALGSDPMLAAFAAIVGLVTAWALFPREVDDSTIDFLRALPVSAAQVFMAKYAAAVLLIALLTSASYALDALALSFNPESMGGRFYPQAFWTLLWRDIVFSAVIIAHGVLISWFRVIGLVVYALYLLGVAWLESQTGSAGVFSVLSMLSNEYRGSLLIPDYRAIGIHVGIALVVLLVAYLLWRRTPSARAGGKTRTRTGKVWRAMVSIAAFVTVGLVLLGLTAQDNGSLVDDSLNVETTAYYRFAFHPADQSTIDYLLEHADADFEQLAELLGGAELPTVRVNLAASSEHAAGLATWKTIRMDLDTFQNDVSQRRVLSHESVHVMQSVVSNRALSRHFAATRFFVEGMAQYLSFLIVPETTRQATNRAIAAVSWERQDIRFENLIDSNFAARFDPDLYYSLGDLWTESFVAVCGQQALGDFLRAAGRDDVPRRLSGDVFWRDTLGFIECELEQVNERFRSDMQTLYEQTDRSRFPRFDQTQVTRLDDGRVRVVSELVAEPGDGDEIVALDPADLPARFAIRVASSANLVASVDPVFRGRAEISEDSIKVVFEIPARAVPRDRFEYQVGYAPYADSRVWYDTRRTGSARRAPE